MRKSDQEQQAFDRLVQWAEKLAVTDVHRFHEEDHWLQDFGKVLTDSKSGQSVFFLNPLSAFPAVKAIQPAQPKAVIQAALRL